MFWFGLQSIARFINELVLLQHTYVGEWSKIFLKLLNLNRKKIKMLFTGLDRSVLGETVPSVWVPPAAYGLWRYSKPRAQFLPIRTSQPVNNIHIIRWLVRLKMSSEDSNKEKIPTLLTNQQREHFFHPSVRRSKTVLAWGTKKQKKKNAWSQVKTVLDYILNSTLWIPELLDSEFFCHWNLDSGFRIPDSNSRNFPDSGICTTLHEAISSEAVQSVPLLHCSHTNIQKDLLPEKSSCKSPMISLACIPSTFQRWLMSCKLLFANKLHIDLHRDNINNKKIIELDATYDFTSRNYSNHQSLNMFQEEKRDRF